MNTRSIRFRLVVWHAGLLTAIFVILACFIYVAVKFQMERNLAENQSRRARQIATSLVAQMGQTSERFVREEIQARFAPEVNSRFVRVLRPDGSVLYVSGNPNDQSFDVTGLPLPSTPITKSASQKEELPRSKQLMVSTVPVSGPAGNYLVQAGSPLEPLQSFLNQLLVWMAIGLVVLVAISVIGGHWLVRRALAPVQKACRSAEQITLQNLSQRLSALSTGDELEQLTTALNLMIARLEDAFLHNRRFMADASHEMRTPLTIVRGELEALVRSPKAGKEIKDSMGSALEEVERLARIVENMFAIARLDAGEAQPKWTKFDFSKLAGGTAEQMLQLAEDKGISITCHAAEPVAVEGDRSRLKQVVVNLLDNAIKYTPKGGAIRLNVRETESKAVLEVEDTGIGIPYDEQAHIFERFYRVDKTRSREMGGAGLGLSIVKSICTAHGGTVEVESNERRGSRFRVELPKASETDEETKE
jgi:heavy metal sensor kinase